MPDQKNKVCKLVKSLYRLKQVSKQWHKKFDSIIFFNGFQINNFDNCLYYKSFNDRCVLLCLYIDDILILALDIDLINDIKTLLSNHFDMRDLGQANIILGMKINTSCNSYCLTQSHYTQMILDKFGYSVHFLLSIPYDPRSQLVKNTDNSINQEKYTQIIESLLYLANRTRPDIAFADSKLSRDTSNPSMSRWIALERVFSYLKDTIS